MNALQSSVCALLSIHPRVITNKFSVSARVLQDGRGHSIVDVQGRGVPEAGAASLENSNDAMADAAEQLITELLCVLSVGLRGDVDVWDVLATLQHVPTRLAESKDNTFNKRTSFSQSVEGGAVSSSPSSGLTGGQREGPGGSREDDAVKDAKQRLCRRLNFTVQLVRIVETTFSGQPRLVHARALLRLALNYGCLLASLELLVRWNHDELWPFFSKPEMNVLFNCGDRGQRWNTFVGIVAPVGGVPLRDLEGGAARGFSLVHFNLALLVPDLDYDGPNQYAEGGVGARKVTTASHIAASGGQSTEGYRPEFYCQLEDYLRGATNCAPSALAFLQNKRKAIAASHHLWCTDPKDDRGQISKRNAAGQSIHRDRPTEERPVKVKVLLLDGSGNTLRTRGHGTEGLVASVDFDRGGVGAGNSDAKGAGGLESDIGESARRSGKHRKARKRRAQAISNTTVTPSSQLTSSDADQKRQEEAYVRQQRLNATQQPSRAPNMIEALRQMRQITKQQMEAATTNTISSDLTGGEEEGEYSKDLLKHVVVSTSPGGSPAIEVLVTNMTSAPTAAAFSSSLGCTSPQGDHDNEASVDKLLDRLESMLDQLAECLGVSEGDADLH
ncbi:unnamed protein product [Phytomonas sp. Hart1]|nr:unnamed protein product [Phytomonas sp. Hart1]|eukprot:CCW65998.1 unnamed protein product [Phytomonas sp. isolate Hart1]